MDLTVYIEQAIHYFSRSHKYTFGSDPRQQSCKFGDHDYSGHSWREKVPVLYGLRERLESPLMPLRIGLEVRSGLRGRYRFASRRLCACSLVSLT